MINGNNDKILETIGTGPWEEPVFADRPPAEMDFVSSWITPAHRTRFAKELMLFPRPYPRTIKRHKNITIEDGFRMNNGRRVPLEKLAYHDKKGKVRGSYLANISRKEWHKHDKHWLLATYPDESFIQGFQIDCDRHRYDNHDTPQERQQADHEFFTKVKNLIELAEELSFDIVWTTSPGNILLEGIFRGEHVQGLYAWIKFNRPIKVKTLREKLVPAFKTYYDIHDETSVDERNRLIRLPQRWVEVCNPLTLKTKFEYDDEHPRDVVNTFNYEWIKATPVDVDALFVPALEWVAKQEAQDATAVAVTASKPKSKSMLSIGLDSNPKFIAEMNKIKNTYDRYVRFAKIPSRLTWKYGGDKSKLELAIAEFDDYILATAKYDSTTCHSSTMRADFARRIMTGFFNPEFFDPTKSKSKNRTENQRGKQDKKRFATSAKIDRSYFLRKAKELCGFSYKKLTMLGKFYDYMMKYSGRIYYKLAHSIFGGKRTWDKMQHLLRDAKLLHTLDNYDRTDSKCRQYGLLRLKQQLSPCIARSNSLSPLSLVSVSCTPARGKLTNKTEKRKKSLYSDDSPHLHWHEAIKTTDTTLTFDEQLEKMKQVMKN